MKTLMSVVTLLCFIVVPTFAQEAKSAKTEAKPEGKWHGYLVDAMCARTMVKKGNPMERAAKHSRDCALEEECAASGYGLLYDGKYYKFDDAGDQKAKDAIEKSSTEKGMMVDVSGKMEGDKIIVASLSEMKMDSKEMGKKLDTKSMKKK
jgi:hypothetical protein